MDIGIVFYFLHIAVRSEGPLTHAPTHMLCALLRLVCADVFVCYLCR